MIFNDRRNAKALKAANGPSLAPKGYQPDKAGRKAVKNSAEKIQSQGRYNSEMSQGRVKETSRRDAHGQAAKVYEMTEKRVK